MDQQRQPTTPQERHRAPVVEAQDAILDRMYRAWRAAISKGGKGDE